MVFWVISERKSCSKNSSNAAFCAELREDPEDALSAGADLYSEELKESESGICPEEMEESESGICPEEMEESGAELYFGTAQPPDNTVGINMSRTRKSVAIRYKRGNR